MEELNKLNEILDISKSKKSIIFNNLLKYKLENIIDISQDVYKDTLIDKWVEELPALEGSKILINNIIHNPINNKTLLEERQLSYIEYNEIDLEILKEYEDDILWTFTLDNEIDEESSINLLYPSNFIIKYMNYIEPVLDLYHMYKIYGIPLISLSYPISIIYGPYYYMNKYFNFNISVKDYIKMLYSFIKMYIKSTGNFKYDLLKLITLIIYIGLYAYSMYQTLEMAYLIYKTKEKLHKKMEGLVLFINESKNIISKIPYNILKPFLDKDIIYNEINLSNTMTDIYRLWKDDTIKNNIKSLLKIIYTIDIINSVSRLKDRDDWCITKYSNLTKMWGMKNPLLNTDQISNPINLSKNIIITGPNAAGKTTYVKSILSNIILSQTFGISNCIKSETILYDTINSFMRITDILGSKSYFEVETEYCSLMIKKAIEMNKNGKNGLFLLDEPMHSTPPTEGMATAYAVIEFIGKLNGLNLIITTHFHKLIELETNYPNNFINLSVEAIKNDNKFYFPYKIKRGYSHQCIAIELLEKQKFPQDVIESAIKMKNKIYNDICSK